MELAGRRAAADVLSELRLALLERRLSAQPTAADGAEARRDRRRCRARPAGARGVLRALPPAGRPRLDRPARRARLGGGHRRRVRAGDGGDASARPGLHVAHRARDRAADTRALGRTGRSRRTSSTWSAGCRRCGRSTAARRSPSGSPRSGSAIAAPRWARCGWGSFRDRSWSCCHARRGARGGDDRRPAGRRRPWPAGGPDGAGPRPRAVRAPAPAGRRVPRQRGRPGGRRADARAPGRRAGRGPRRDAAAAEPGRRPGALRSGVLRLSVATGCRARRLRPRPRAMRDRGARR